MGYNYELTNLMLSQRALRMLTFEPSAGTLDSEDGDTYLDTSGGRLITRVGGEWVSYDVSVGL